MFEELFAAPTLVLTSYRKLLQEMNLQSAAFSLNNAGFTSLREKAYKEELRRGESTREAGQAPIGHTS